MKCSFINCNRSVFVKSTNLGPLCNGHYAQYRKRKPLSELREYLPREVDDSHARCPIDGCGRPSWHKIGLCQSHQRQAWDDTPNHKEIRQYSFQRDSKCKVNACDEAAKSNGFCSKHYRSDWGNCTVPGCSRRMYNKATQYCANHYIKARKQLKKPKANDNE